MKFPIFPLPSPSPSPTPQTWLICIKYCSYFDLNQQDVWKFLAGQKGQALKIQFSSHTHQLWQKSSILMLKFETNHLGQIIKHCGWEKERDRERERCWDSGHSSSCMWFDSNYILEINFKCFKAPGSWEIRELRLKISELRYVSAET